MADSLDGLGIALIGLGSVAAVSVHVNGHESGAFLGLEKAATQWTQPGIAMPFHLLGTSPHATLRAGEAILLFCGVALLVLAAAKGSWLYGLVGLFFLVYGFVDFATGWT